MPLTLVLAADCRFGCPFPFLLAPFLISCALADDILVPPDSVVTSPESAMMEDGLRTEGLEVPDGEGRGRSRFAGSVTDCGNSTPDWDLSEGTSQIVRFMISCLERN